MKTFYEVLTPYYDELFPVNDKQISFLSSCFPLSSQLLDIGAGTGNTAIALAELGYQLTASEPEPSMTIRIKDKLDHNKKIHINVSQHHMQQIDQFNESFDGIYCIGNTLPHLHNLVEIRSFLQSSYDKLKEHGTIVIQTVNFDKVLHQQEYAFPIIEKESFTFTRHYHLHGDRVMFTTILKDQSTTYSNTLPLYPVTSNQLKEELHKCGFHSISVFGNYAKSPFNIEAPALILTASK